MDIILLVLVIVLIIILAVVYRFNKVPKIYDLDRLFTNIRLQDPSVVAFTLRYDPQTNQYVNVTYNAKGEAQTRREKYPVDTLGSYIIPKDHGVVENLENGFRISGLDTVTFGCPEGYVGSNCTLRPLCESGVDDGKLKPLTYTQFNDLHLSYNSDRLVMPQSRRKRSADQEAVHPRIRIQCLTDGAYELQSCPDNKLLNNELQCKAYDICQDKISGYKHNSKISESDAPLNRTEYYICENGASVKTQCSEGTVFSMSSNGCILESVCFGKGNQTIYRDEKSYIRCNNDIGTVVHCVNKVVQDTNKQWSCQLNTCEPRTMSYEDDTIAYAYGRTVCENDMAKTTMCQTNAKTRSFEYEWATKFSYKIDNWPEQVLNLETGICEPSTLDILRGPVKLAWSDAMSQSYPFNLKTEQFLCDDKTTKYRWDYLRGMTVPKTNLFVDTGAPCQTQAYDQIPWDPDMRSVQYPIKNPSKPFTNPPALYGTVSYFGNYNWPVYLVKEKKYRVDILSIDDSSLVIDSYTSDIPPLGFTLKQDAPIENSEQLLELTGVGIPNDPRDYKWRTIASGKFDVIRSSGTAKRTTYKTVSKYDLTVPGKCPIIWKKLTDKEYEFITDTNNVKYTLSNKSLNKNGVHWRPAYTLLDISKAVDNIVSITFTKALTIKIDLNIQKTLVFNYV